MIRRQCACKMCLLLALLAMVPLPCQGQSDRSNELFAKGVELYQQGKYEEAIPVFEQVQSLDEREMAETSPRRGYAASWLAACYTQIGQMDKAQEILPNEYMLTPVDRRQTVESDRLSERAMFFYESGNFEKALEYFRKCGETEQKLLPTHSFYANTLSLMAECLTSLARYDEAKPLLLKSIDIYKHDKYESGRLISELALGWCYQYLDDRDSALVCFEDALQGLTLLRQSADTPNVSYYYADAIAGKGITYYLMGNMECESLLKKAKDILEQIEITNSYYYDRILYYLLGMEYLMKDSETTYDTAIELRKKFEQDDLTQTTEYLDVIHLAVLAGNRWHKISSQHVVDYETLVMTIAKSNIGTDNDYYVRALNQIALTYLNDGKTTQAEQTGKEALNIIEKPDCQVSPDIAAYTYQLMGNILISSFMVDKAVEMFNNSYQIYQQYQIANHDYILLLRDMVSVFSNIDRLDEATAVGEQFLDIYKSAKWPVDVMYCTVVVSLQGVYETLGNSARRRELLSLARKAYDNNPTFPRNTYVYVTLLQAECSEFLKDKKFDEAIMNAEEMLSQATSTDEDFNHMCQWSSQFMLAQAYVGKGERERGLACILTLKDMELKGENMGKATAYTTSIGGMMSSIVKMVQDDYQGAIAQARQALKEYDQLHGFGENNQMRLNILNAITSYAWEAGDRATLMGAVVEQSTFIRSFVRSHFQTMTYQERCDFWAKYGEWFNVQIPNATLQVRGDTLQREAYNAMLMGKGILLNSEIEVTRLIDEKGNEETKQLYRQFQQHKALLASQQVSKLTTQEKDFLQRVLYQEEKDVMLVLSEKFGDYTKRLDVTWEQVREALKDGESAIEFMVSPLTEDSIVYSALVLRPGYESPHLVRLFIEPQLAGIEQHMVYTTDEASQLIWRPLDDELCGVNTVYFSSAGLLHNIGIEFLLKDGLLISDTYTLHRLSSTREIVFRQSSPDVSMAVLYGGIDYNAGADAISESNRSQHITATSGYRPRSIHEREALGGVQPLPETAKEVEQITLLLGKSNIPTQSFLHQHATEESVKMLSGHTPTWLHIATHGFFWSEELSHIYGDRLFMQQSLLLTLMDENSQVAVEDKVMSRTGLLFAGAELSMLGEDFPQNMDDGILTSQEISRLDFRGTDLVVLSACETAKGDVLGDGIFGLQRGFKKAGAKTLMMSLWRVDDLATRLLMCEFYRNVTVERMPKHKALLEAQQYLRAYDGGKFSSPRFWAAFILLDALD